MKIDYCEQRSETWYRLRAGSIGGNRLGSATSGRKNRLAYDLLNEQLNGIAQMDDYINDDMMFGIENEPIARDKYSGQCGIKFAECGLIQSEQSAIHHASPDGINLERGIVLEIKCTANGAIHLQRFFEGVEPAHIPQIVNYFAVSDEIKEVHWVSYCPERTERPLIVFLFDRDTYTDSIRIAREKITEIEDALKVMKSKFIF